MLRRLFNDIMPVIMMLVVMATLVLFGCAIFNEQVPPWARSGSLMFFIIGTRGLHKMMEGAVTGKVT